MATRCQVKITGKNDATEAVTLYHHYDGCPTSMVPLIADAYAADWKHGFVGKVASFVVSRDPAGYDIEADHGIHGDIEWYYVLEVGSETHVEAVPKWFLTVYDAKSAYVVSDMRKVFSGLIQDAIPLAESMGQYEGEDE